MQIRSRLMAAFIVVIAIAVGMMGFASMNYIDEIFARYAEEYRSTFAEQWGFIFLSYYLNTGSWEGVESVLDHRGRWGLGSPGTRGQMAGGMRGTLPGERLLLADAEGRVVLDSKDELAGESLGSRQLERGYPLEINGRTVGVLLFEPTAPGGIATLEEQFSRSLLAAVAWGVALALLVGAVLSFVVSGQVARPVDRLIHSARRFAQRDFGHRVKMERGDEVGKLGEAFNYMAESIEESERLRTNLLADVAHELRTPLTVLRGNFESMQSGKLQPTPEILSSLYDEVLRLNRLVRDLEAVNLAEAGSLSLQRREVNVESLLSRVAHAFQHEANQRGIDFSVEVGEKGQSWTLDEDRFMQVVINLLANAFRATPDDGIVSLRSEQKGGDLQLEVGDSGPGIPEEDLPFIFDRFYRAGSGRREEGSGLGLSIARSFVEAHGGTLKATNRPEGGTLFTVTLP